LCWRNDGQGRFTPFTLQAGTSNDLTGMTLALADVDGNGTIDIYTANNRSDDIRDRGQVQLSLVRGRPTVPRHFADRLTLQNGELLEYGEPDQLWLNVGGGKFEAVSWTNGAFLDESGKPLKDAPRD